MYVSLFEQCYVSNKNKITSLAISYTGTYVFGEGGIGGGIHLIFGILVKN